MLRHGDASRNAREVQMKDCQSNEPVKNEQEEQYPTCSTGCCCGLDGPGGKVRLVIMIVAAVTAIALTVHGFAG